MPSLINYSICRTENICINKINYTIRFLKQNDSSEYRLLIINEFDHTKYNKIYTEESYNELINKNKENLKNEINKTINKIGNEK